MDADNRYIGMVSQSDLLASLYEGRLHAPVPAPAVS
ncbi:hypothetical protein [Massilia sp. TWR1-2-2]